MEILKDMSFAEYLARPELSSSGLKHLLESPMKFWYERNKKAEPTKAQLAGSLMHALVLGREKTEFVLIPEVLEGVNKNTKVYRDWKAEQVLTPVSTREIDDLRLHLNMIDEIDFLFSGGQPEVSVFWDEGGTAMKARFDYINHSSKIFIDLKTLGNIDGDFGEACANHFWRYQIYIQMCLYQRATIALFGEPYIPMVVFVDRDCPRAVVRTFTAKSCPDIWKYANARIDKAIELYGAYDEKYINEPWVDPVDMRDFWDTDFPKAMYLGQD